MFCNNCGKKIKAGSSRCSCGAPVEQMEYCGGFWGLVGKKPEKPRRNDIGESQSSPNPVERPVLNTSHVGYENSENSFENDERRKRSSGAGIGLIIGCIMAAVVLIGGGAFFLMKKGNPEPPVKTAKEEETKVSEATERPEEITEVTEKQLEYQYKYLKYRFDEMEEKESLLEDPNSDEVLNSSEQQKKSERDWAGFEELVGTESVEGSISQEFEQFKADYSSYGEETAGFSKEDFDELDKKLHMAQLDLKVHKEFPDISKTEDGIYEWGDAREESANAEMAKEIINEYEKLQPKAEGKTTEPYESFLNSDTFASGLTLTRMEALLYDYCINYYKDKLGVGDEESLNKSVTSKDYQTAKKNAGDDQDFEGDHDNLWYAEWCINDLQNNAEAAMNNLTNLPEDAENIKNLRESNPDKEKEKDSTSTEESTQGSKSTEESTQGSKSTEESTQRPKSTEDLTQGSDSKEGFDRNGMNSRGYDYKKGPDYSPSDSDHNNGSY